MKQVYLLLVFCLMSVVGWGQAVITEWSQGTGGLSEWIEITVTSTTSLRNWQLGDNDDNSFSLIVTFADDAVWDNISAGTVIVVYNGGDIASSITAAGAPDTDFSDNVVIIPSNNTSFFVDASGGWTGGGAFANSDSDDQPALRNASGTMIYDVEGSGGPSTGANSLAFFDGSNWQSGADPADATPGSSALPIDLIAFNGQRINSTTHLHWRTSTEINNDYMAIERSSDGRTFEEIGRVQGAGTTQVEQSYSFVDERPLSGVNYYRLRQVDFDGKYEYHKTIAVDFTSEATNKLVVYPTQVKDHLQIVAGTEMNEETQVQVLSADGRIWQTTPWLEKSHQLELSVKELPAGSYWLRVLDGKSVRQAYFQKI